MIRVVIDNEEHRVEATMEGPEGGGSGYSPGLVRAVAEDAIVMWFGEDDE